MRPCLGGRRGVLVSTASTVAYKSAARAAIDAAEKDVMHAMKVWNDREYADLSIHGYLANTIPMYGCLGAQVHIGVRDVSQLPHVEAARHRVLARILTEPQPYEAAVPVSL